MVSQPCRVYTSPGLEQRPSASLLGLYSYTVSRPPPGCINLSCAVCSPFLSHAGEGRVLISWQRLEIHIKSLLLLLLLPLSVHHCQARKAGRHPTDGETEEASQGSIRAAAHQIERSRRYLRRWLHNTVKNQVERPRGPSCLYIMRATFLLPLARMLAAFYRAIKAVNQSLLNDLCFLTCFTGGGGTGTVAAALHTHGRAPRDRHQPRLSGL